jgi:phytoene dehydrogenase-like protein
MREYDAIVIGAGHNGLCCAAYLQRAGLSTAVIERRHEEGGGINTEEPVLAGYRFNMHANYMEFFDIIPMIPDFDLYDIGLRSFKPENQAGIVFSDGRPPIVLHRKDLLDKTHVSISRYSKADADTWLELQNRTMDFGELMAIGIYNLPDASHVEAQGVLLEAMFSDMGVGAHYATKSPKMVIDEVFESPEMRTLLYRASVEFGAPLDQLGSGAQVLLSLQWMIGNLRGASGGTHSLAKAMTQACYAEGVDLIENRMVEKIIVEDGRAVGVVARGEEIRARKVVASNADVRQTLIDLVGEENLSPLWAKRAKDFRYGPSAVLATPVFCLREAPDYKSARWDADINKTFYTVVGYDQPEDVARYVRDAHSGRIPEPAAGTWINSLWDPSQAPPGRHSASGWYFFPKASYYTPEQWAEIRATYNDRFIARWGEFAPNMTRDNVIADRLYTPDEQEVKNLMWEGDCLVGEMTPDQSGANRPFPEGSSHRMEIQGLYLCGPSSYPGGGAHAAPGYQTAKVILDDLGIPAPIPEGRAY